MLITEVGNRSHKVSKDLVYIFFVPFLLLRIFWHGDKDISAGDGLASIRNIKAARKKKMHQFIRNSCKNAHLILISFYAVRHGH